MQLFTLSLIKNRLLNKKRIQFVLKYRNFSKKPPWSVMFFGTDDFSIYSLEALHNEYRKGNLVNKLDVVTTIKRPPNPVQKFAEKQQLKFFNWPLDVSGKQYDLGLVVSFGHLIPEKIITKFPLGILNVHASLLPRWRGAAPIIYALANGDTQTGVTIMRIKPKKFDVGDIVSQIPINIPSDMKMPDLHDKLGRLGAEEIVRVLKHLPESLSNTKPQSDDHVTFAPKITPDFATIDWTTMDSTQIYNRERSLIGVYALATNWLGKLPVKLQDIQICSNEQFEQMKPGFVLYHKPTKTLNVCCANNTWIRVGKVKVHGKRVMEAADFHNGYIKKEPPDCRYFR